MPTGSPTTNRGTIMSVVGVIGLVAAVVWLFVVDDPFPMWLVLAGGGLTFIGAGAAIRR